MWLQQSVQAWQTVPSLPAVQFETFVGATHVPTVAPAFTEQLPPQQSLSRAHTSPFWMQKEAAIWQVPL
jgi:hypothetical protein